MDKCLYCPNEAEYKVMVEDDENPIMSHTEDVCGECLYKIEYKTIEAWTKQEWLNDD